MPSFIHTSRQSSGVTRSPYHWWASSWTDRRRRWCSRVSPSVIMRLGLHAALGVDDEDAGGVEGVGAEVLLEEGQRRRAAAAGRRSGSALPRASSR